MSFFRRMVAAGTGVVLAFSSSGMAGAAEALSAEEERRVTDYVVAEMQALGVPGAAVAIVRATDVVFAQGFGVTGVGDERVTAQTPFYIASVSKSLTALAVMQLVEAGHLALSDQLSELLPGLIPDGSEVGMVTVQNLLGHTSGWTEGEGLTDPVDGDDPSTALQSNVARIVATPLSNPIGVFEYSNANYALLGYLIEQVSGEPYGDYMRRRVFEPLGMTHSSAFEAEAIEAGVAAGHYPYFGVVRLHPMWFRSGEVPAGFLSASAQDLGHFLIAHLNEGRYRDGSVLSSDGINALQRPVVHPNAWDGYAGGLWMWPLWNAGRLVVDDSGEGAFEVPVMLEHGGSTESYASAILLLPEEKLGVVTLLNINDESVDSLYHQMHLGIANILLGLDPPPTIPLEGPIYRFGKIIALAVLGLVLVRVGISALRLRRFQRSSPTTARPSAMIVRHVVAPMAVDLFLVGATWWFLAAQADAPLTLVRRSVPDIFLTAAVVSVIAIGWGIARSVLTLRTVAERRATASFERPDPIPLGAGP